MLHLLWEYLESANGRNAKFLNRLRDEGSRHEALNRINELGAVQMQQESIVGAAVLLAATVAYIKD